MEEEVELEVEVEVEVGVEVVEVGSRVGSGKLQGTKEKLLLSVFDVVILPDCILAGFALTL